MKEREREKRVRDLFHQQKDDLDGVTIPTPKIQQQILHVISYDAGRSFDRPVCKDCVGF